MGILTIKASIDGVMHGSAPTGDHSPIWSQTVENFDAGHYVMNPQISAPDPQRWLAASRDMHSTSTQALDADTVKSTGVNSLKASCDSFVENIKSDAHIGRIWFNANDRSEATDIEYFQHQYTQYARDGSTEGTDSHWLNNYYNRIRLWVKVSTNIEFPAYPSWQQMDIGTYVRATWGDYSQQEEGGWHYYFLYNFGSTEQWHQIIIDGAPQVIREAGAHPDISPIMSGTTAVGGEFLGDDWESGVNYFDQLTSFYISYGMRDSDDHDVESWIKLDEIEFYKEPYDEIEPEKVSSLNGVYDPSVNRLYVAWVGNRLITPEDTSVHEAVYSFNNIHENGWSSGISLGTMPDVAHKDKRVDRTDIDMGSNDIIYIAARPVGETLFRQISIPLTQTGYDLVVDEKRDFT